MATTTDPIDTVDGLETAAKETAAAVIEEHLAAFEADGWGVFESSTAAAAGLKTQSGQFIEYLTALDELSAKQTPETVASGAIHAAAVVLRLASSIETIAEWLDVSPDTVRRYYTPIREAVSDELTTTGTLETAAPYLSTDAQPGQLCLATGTSTLNESLAGDTASSVLNRYTVR